MWFEWHYKSLTAEEVLIRRASLDRTGHISIAAQLALLFFAAAVRWLTTKLRKQNSPLTIGRIEWTLFHSPFTIYGTSCYSYREFDTLGFYLIFALYAAWQLFLAMKGSGDDYLYVTKAFGMLAASHLPLSFLLAGKPDTFIRRWLLMGYTYDRVNIVHRWVGRFIFTLASVHVSLYLKFFWDTHRITTRILEWEVMCGVVAFLLLVVVYITAIPLIRHRPGWYFRVFYLTHIVAVTAISSLLWFHVEQHRLYLIISAIISTQDYVVRTATTLKGKASVVLEGNRTLHVQITLDKPVRQELLAPGVHLLLTFPEMHKHVGNLRSNPFTIASTSVSSDGRQTLNLFLRRGIGFTKKLLEYSNDEQASPSCSIFIAPSPLLPDFLLYDRIVLIAGGVGGTFCVPLSKHLLSTFASRSGSPNPAVRLYWAVKEPREIHWAITDSTEDFRSSLEVYVTSASPPQLEPPQATEGEGAEEYELQERLISQEPRTSSDNLLQDANVRFYTRRPDVGGIIETEIKACPHVGALAIIVCGPESMSRSVRRSVQTWIKGGNELGLGLWFWEEGFGL